MCAGKKYKYRPDLCFCFHCKTCRTALLSNSQKIKLSHQLHTYIMSLQYTHFHKHLLMMTSVLKYPFFAHENAIFTKKNRIRLICLLNIASFHMGTLKNFRRLPNLIQLWIITNIDSSLLLHRTECTMYEASHKHYKDGISIRKSKPHAILVLISSNLRTQPSTQCRHCALEDFHLHPTALMFRQNSRKAGSSTSGRARRATLPSSFARRGSSELRGMIAARWIPGEKIGEGGFGMVISAKDVKYGNIVAVKFVKDNRNAYMLEKEMKVYEALRNGRATEGVVRCKYFGPWRSGQVLVLPMLGPSLRSLKREHGGIISLRRILRIAISANRAIKSVHDVGYLHRDVKPENFLTEKNNSTKVYLVDFGMAKVFSRALRDRNTRPGDLNDRLVGDLHYASISSMQGREPSFRDDFVSLGYTLIYLCKGQLPWQRNTPRDRKKFQAYCLQMKVQTSIADLCSGTCSEVTEFFRYVESLRFTSRVDHHYVESLFAHALYRVFEEHF